MLRRAGTVVGAGRWAQRAHIPGWQRDPRVEVVALADTDPAILAEAGAKFGVKKLVSDYRELCADPDIDVIDVATANRAHYEISAAALRAGKHVLCEKPVHHDFRETRALSELVKTNGVKTKLGFTFRYAPAVLWHDDTAAFDAGSRSALASSAMRQNAAVAGMFGRAVTRLAVVTSAGVAHHTLATEASGSLTATVDEGTSHWIDLHRSASALGIEPAIERTVREATAGRGRGPLADGHYSARRRPAS